MLVIHKANHVAGQRPVRVGAEKLILKNQTFDFERFDLRNGVLVHLQFQPDILPRAGQMRNQGRFIQLEQRGQLPGNGRGIGNCDTRVRGHDADRLAVGQQVAVAIADLASATVTVDDLFAVGGGFPAELRVAKNVQLDQSAGERREG